MKVLLIVSLATCLATLSWATPLTSDEFGKKCLVQENVPAQYFADYLSEKIKPENVTPNFKCFVRCLLEARGYMKDGVLLEANVVKDATNISNVAMVQKIIADCKIVKGNNVCETSFNIFTCISKQLM